MKVVELNDYIYFLTEVYPKNKNLTYYSKTQLQISQSSLTNRVFSDIKKILGDTFEKTHNITEYFDKEVTRTTDKLHNIKIQVKNFIYNMESKYSDFTLFLSIFSEVSIERMIFEEPINIFNEIVEKYKKNDCVYILTESTDVLGNKTYDCVIEYKGKPSDILRQFTECISLISPALTRSKSKYIISKDFKKYMIETIPCENIKTIKLREEDVDDLKQSKIYVTRGGQKWLILFSNNGIFITNKINIEKVSNKVIYEKDTILQSIFYNNQYNIVDCIYYNGEDISHYSYIDRIRNVDESIFNKAEIFTDIIEGTEKIEGDSIVYISDSMSLFEDINFVYYEWNLDFPFYFRVELLKKIGNKYLYTLLSDIKKIDRTKPKYLSETMLETEKLYLFNRDISTGLYKMNKKQYIPEDVYDINIQSWNNRNFSKSKLLTLIKTNCSVKSIRLIYDYCHLIGIKNINNLSFNDLKQEIYENHTNYKRNNNKKMNLLDQIVKNNFGEKKETIKSKVLKRIKEQEQNALRSKS